MTILAKELAITNQTEAQYNYKCTPALLRVFVTNMKHTHVSKKSKNNITAYILSAPVREVRGEKLKPFTVELLSKELSLKTEHADTIVNQLHAAGLVKCSNGVYYTSKSQIDKLIDPSFNTKLLAKDLFVGTISFKRMDVIKDRFNLKYTNEMVNMGNLEFKLTSKKKLGAKGVSNEMVSDWCRKEKVRQIKIEKSVDLPSRERTRNFFGINNQVITLPTMFFRDSYKKRMKYEDIDITNNECDVLRDISGIEEAALEADILLNPHSIQRVMDSRLAIKSAAYRINDFTHVTGDYVYERLHGINLTTKAYLYITSAKSGLDNYFKVQSTHQFESKYASNVIKCHKLSLVNRIVSRIK
jgi:hypothetical protein